MANPETGRQRLRRAWAAVTEEEVKSFQAITFTATFSAFLLGGMASCPKTVERYRAEHRDTRFPSQFQAQRGEPTGAPTRVGPARLIAPPLRTE